MIENAGLKKRVLDLEDEKKETMKVSSKLHADAKGLKEKVKDWKSKYKTEIERSKELRKRLRSSEDLFEFLSQLLEKQMKINKQKQINKIKVRKTGF